MRFLSYLDEKWRHREIQSIERARGGMDELIKFEARVFCNVACVRARAHICLSFSDQGFRRMADPNDKDGVGANAEDYKRRHGSLDTTLKRHNFTCLCRMLSCEAGRL